MDNPSFELEVNSLKKKPSEKMTVDIRARRSPITESVVGKALLLLTVVLFVICVVFIALYAVEKDKDSTSNPSDEASLKPSNKTSYSEEAKRIALEDFLKKVQSTYYEYHREKLPWQSHKTPEEIGNDLKERHLPYNVAPAYLKSKTDAAFSLLQEVQDKNIDETKLKPSEVRIVEQLRNYLKTVFGNPFDENFYNADWMLGPNHFCWQAICSIPYNINGHALFVTKPTNLDELRAILKAILLNRETILQYKSNMQLGVQAGMVRSIESCESGFETFKQQFKNTSKDNDPKGVLKEWFVQLYRSPNFIKNIPKADQEKWIEMHKKNISTSINENLIEGIGQPLIELINYIEYDHLKHCSRTDHSSGLANLPLDFIHINGTATTNRTTKTLPISNDIINASQTYKSILRYFTTSDITPEEINEIGNKRLNKLYPQVVAIAQNVTRESNETTAIAQFRKLLKKQIQYYNTAPFPVNESDDNAHKNCTDEKSAEKNCPVRWAAYLKWVNIARQTMAMLAPKLIPLFYHTGEKITVPNCPVRMKLNPSPSSGAQAFQQSDSSCSRPTTYYLPFFLENFGPKFSEWSVTAHETWPGHHTQVQGQMEYFSGKYTGVTKWFNDQTAHSIFFAEGWGLYAENPLIAQDTDIYKNNPFQKYGMLKWQIWRALRLIVDTGLHYRGMTRSEALDLFSKYAWDDSDVAHKEVLRYQGVPGQATSYMLGQEKLIEERRYAEKKLGKKFNLQDFHYQVLSQGSLTAGSLTKHVQKYVKCMLGELKGQLCDDILKAPKKSDLVKMTRKNRQEPARRPILRYL